MAGDATKNILLRLDPGDAARLQAVAEVEGRTVSDVAREAVQELVSRRRKDGRFQRLLQQNLERHRALLDDLAGEQ